MQKITKRRPEEKESAKNNEQSILLKDTDGHLAIRDAVKELQATDKQAYEQLVTLAKFLNVCEVDMRHLSMVKACFNSKESKEKGQLLESVPLNVLTECVNKTFAQFRRCDEIAERFLAYLARKTDDSDPKEPVEVPFSRLAVLLDFVKQQAISPVREKNASPGFDFVMQTKISQSRPSEKSLGRADEDVNALLEFVWQKI